MKATVSAVCLLSLFTCTALAVPAGSAGCSTSQQASYPKASITNGPVQAVLYLPDAKSGYYRASRFDWSGVVPCLAYEGHTYFGIWFSHYDPMLADAIAGPVEEFRSSDGALDYAQAKAGDLIIDGPLGDEIEPYAIPEGCVISLRLQPEVLVPGFESEGDAALRARR